MTGKKVSQGRKKKKKKENLERSCIARFAKVGSFESATVAVKATSLSVTLEFCPFLDCGDVMP